MLEADKKGEIMVPEQRIKKMDFCIHGCDIQIKQSRQKVGHVHSPTFPCSTHYFFDNT